MSNAPFTIERTYNAPVSKVWEAITKKEHMKQWYFDLKEFKPKVGFEFRFTGGEPGGKQFLHICVITEVSPEKKLSHSWRYDGYEGISYVTWELFAEGDKTRVKLTHAGLDTFPKEKAFAKENFEAGWTDILGRSLKTYLEK